LNIARTVLSVLLNRPGDDEIILDRDEFAVEKMAYLARRIGAYAENSDKRKKLDNILMEIGMGNSYELKKADLSIGIQKDMVSLHKTRFIPQLSLQAKYSYRTEFDPEVNERKDNWLIGGVLSIPLFEGYDFIYKGKTLDRSMDALLYKKDCIRFDNYQKILTHTERLVNLANTLPMMYFTKNKVKSHMEVAYERFKLNQFNSFDLIRMGEDSYGKEIDLVEQKYQFYRTYSDLLNSLGIGYLFHGTGAQKEFLDIIENYIESN
jgi:hypothetical protein